MAAIVIVTRRLVWPAPIATGTLVPAKAWTVRAATERPRDTTSVLDRLPAIYPVVDIPDRVASVATAASVRRHFRQRATMRLANEMLGNPQLVGLWPRALGSALRRQETGNRP